MKSKAVFIGAIIGGLFGLIGYLLLFVIKNFGEGGVPLLWPVVFTYGISAGIIILLGFSPETSLSLYLAGILNIILWIVIGSLIGWLIKKTKNEKPHENGKR